MTIKRLLSGFFVMALILGSYTAQARAEMPVSTGMIFSQAANSPDETKLYGYTPIQEMAIGRYVAYALLNRFDNKMVTDPAINDYVNLVGKSIVRSVSKRPQITYKFGIIDTNEINAFACPGGYVFITSGLLKILANEHELAAVLAHEVGHIEHGDGLKDIRNNYGKEYAQYNVDKLASSTDAVYDMAAYTPYVGSYVSYYSPKNMAKRQIGSALGRIPGGYGGYVASGVANQAASAAVDVAATALMEGAKRFGAAFIENVFYKKMSPDVEFQADTFSVNALATMGYNPEAMGDFLKLLQILEMPDSAASVKTTGSQNVLRYTHPSTEDRIEVVDKIMSKDSFNVKNPQSASMPVFKTRFKGNMAKLD
jgi:predicted Zn-dependent protease